MQEEVGDTNPSEIKIPFADQRSQTGGNMCFYFAVFQIKSETIK